MSTQLRTNEVPESPALIYRYHDIRSVHLELTHRCNAACPMCARNLSGGATNPNLPLVELSLADIKKILSLDFVVQLNQIYACGNYGDPIVARDCLGIFKYLRDGNPELNLCMHTNGSARRADWWQQLAEILKSGPHYVRFGIDGLEDTNHLYRRGTNWQTVMQSAQTFIDAGGRAEWDFLVFRHNEHQVEKARELAGKMGFSEFFVRKTGRFIKNNTLKTMDKFEVLNKKGEFDYYLEQPLDRRYLNPAFAGLPQLQYKHDNYQNYIDNVEIRCKAAKKSKIYISAEGLALPCCWLAATFSEMCSPDRRQFSDMVENYGGRQMLDAREHGLKAVIEGRIFQQQISGSWSLPSVDQGKLAICARFCGVEYDSLGRQRQ